jgi:hypothetical protein
MASLRVEQVKGRYIKIYKILMIFLRVIIHNKDSTRLRQSRAQQ